MSYLPTILHSILRIFIFQFGSNEAVSNPKSIRILIMRRNFILSITSQMTLIIHINVTAHDTVLITSSESSTIQCYISISACAIFLINDTFGRFSSVESLKWLYASVAVRTHMIVERETSILINVPMNLRVTYIHILHPKRLFWSLMSHESVC